jgi:hypothetical protein
VSYLLLFVGTEKEFGEDIEEKYYGVMMVSFKKENKNNDDGGK